MGEREKGGGRLQKVRREMGGRGRRENKGEDRQTKKGGRSEKREKQEKGETPLYLPLSYQH